MKIYVAIDDTDSLEVGATGETANQIIKMIISKQWGSCQGLTRHQLLLHPDIPYTSHNSSMCFTADIEAGFLDLLIKEAGEFLELNSAPGSDPGLCVAVEGCIRDERKLINYGYEAKGRVIGKEEAYLLAGELGVHLTEHGGTGIGVIGALAGVGLRMTDNDGRFQGKLVLRAPGSIITVAEILRNGPTERVQSLEGYPLGVEEEVKLGDKLKTVLLKGKRTLLVYQQEGTRWETCTNAHLEKY